MVNGGKNDRWQIKNTFSKKQRSGKKSLLNRLSEQLIHGRTSLLPFSFKTSNTEKFNINNKENKNNYA